MRKWKCIMWMVLAVAMSGCLTPKPTVKAVENVRSAAESQASSQLESDLKRDVEQSVKRVSDAFFTRLSKLELSREKREYSPPDSAGRQYLISEENSWMKRRDKEAGERSEQEDVKYRVVTEQLTRIMDKQEMIEKTIRNLNIERKARLSWWQSMLMCVGAISVICVAFRLYAKNKKP